MTTNNPWQLQRSVPLTLLFGLMCQAGAIVWSASVMNSNIDANTKDIRALEGRVGAIEAAVQQQAISQARIDENIKAIRSILERVTASAL